MLLGYHYSLLKLSGQAPFHYPGLALIDFPLTLADGTSIGDKENYLVEPFVQLAKDNGAVQVVIAGRAFRALADTNRLELTRVWQQGSSDEEPERGDDDDGPGEA